jgi:hypoxanthine-DNA glycosylase
MAKQVPKRPLICSFPPIAARNARVIVLGTMPSIVSLAARQYYAHPQNAFWRIMGELFGAGRDVPYEDRKAILRGRGVAVWDVLRECHRPGSLDSSIVMESETPNDFVTFFRTHAEIRNVFFNGQKAESLFRRHAQENIESLGRELRFVRLPSTSPAHAGRTFAQKLAAWRAVARALRDD